MIGFFDSAFPKLHEFFGGDHLSQPLHDVIGFDGCRKSSKYSICCFKEENRDIHAALASTMIVAPSPVSTIAVESKAPL